MNSQEKIVCPSCGSDNLQYYVETTKVEYYDLDENNMPIRRSVNSIDNTEEEEFNYECDDCGTLFGGSMGAI